MGRDGRTDRDRPAPARHHLVPLRPERRAITNFSSTLSSEDSSLFLVTGATGNVGVKTVTELLRRGHRVRALVRAEDERSAALRTRGVEIAVGDLLDFASLRRALNGVNGAYLGYPPSNGIVEGTAWFALAAQEAGVGVVVNMSQVTARPDAESHVTLGHWTAEQLLDWSGLPVVHLRPTLFFDWLIYLEQAVRDGQVQMAWDDAKLALVSTSDVSRVIARILESPGEHLGQTYELYGPEEISFADAYARISRIIGRPIVYEQMPLETYRESIRGVLPDFLGQHFYEATRDHAAGLFSGTNDVIEEITGRIPTGLTEFTREHETLLRGSFVRAS